MALHPAQSEVRSSGWSNIPDCKAEPLKATVSYFGEGPYGCCRVELSG